MPKFSEICRVAAGAPPHANDSYCRVAPHSLGFAIPRAV
jgi:hypothetical protein